MRTKVKYAVINRHRNEYAVSVMCKFFEVSRSGYYDFVRRIGQTESDAELAKKIQECQDQTDKTYCGLQDSVQTDGQSCVGYDPAGDEEREKESRCGVAAPQRPGLSIYLSWIF